MTTELDWYERQNRQRHEDESEVAVKHTFVIEVKTLLTADRAKDIIVKDLSHWPWFSVEHVKEE